MIIPVVKTINNIYVKENSFFLDLFDIDDNFYYFNVYFDFHINNVLTDNIIDFKFEIVDNSKNLTQSFIDSELKKANLPEIDENNSEYYQKKEIIDNFIFNLKKDNSIIYFKVINITKSINNLNKTKNFIIKKRNKINVQQNNIINNFNYRELYLRKTDELKLDFFKNNIENDFLFLTQEFTSDFITHKELIKIDKNLLNSNILTINLKIENNSSYKNISKIINISDIISYIAGNNNIVYKFIKNKNEFIINNNFNLKIGVNKTDLLTNNSIILYNGKDKEINVLNNKSNDKNIVYTLLNNNDEIINYSIKEYSLIDTFNDYNVNIMCYNTIKGIYVKTFIENNIENSDFIIKKRDLTNKNSNFEEIIVNLDIDVKSYHVYEYALFHKSNMKNFIKSFIIDRPNIKFSNKEFNVKVDNSEDIIFNINFLRENENFISILKTFDLYDQYQELLINNNQSIKDIFYYKIDRYNNDTGEFYNLGWTNENFSDLNFSKKNLISNRDKNFNYTYFITAYNVLSIMFLKENIQTLIGSNNRKYLFDKNKWIHPLLLEKSISTTKNSRNSLFGKNEFEYGFASETILINVPKENPVDKKNFLISNLSTNRKYKNYIVLEWIAENINNINHLLVTKINDNSYEEIIDKITIKNGKNLYFYTIDNNDIKVQLNIYPILNNFIIKDKYSFETIEV